MYRRGLMEGAAAAALARPAIAGKAQTLAIVPQVALNSIDPVRTSSQIARNMGFMVFDPLYGRDEQMNPRPRMLEGDLMEDEIAAGRCDCAKTCGSMTTSPRDRVTASLHEGPPACSGT